MKMIPFMETISTKQFILIFEMTQFGHLAEYFVIAILMLILT